MTEAVRDYVAAHGLRVISPADLGPESLIAAIEATGASSLFIHIDLDVFDPGELRGIGCPEPQGVSAAALIALQLVYTYVPFMNELFGSRPLAAWSWILPVVLSVGERRSAYHGPHSPVVGVLRTRS